VGLQPGLSLRVDGGQGWTAVNASIHDYKHIDNRGAAINPGGQTAPLSVPPISPTPADPRVSG